MAERTPAVPRELEVLHATTGPGQPSGGAQACCGPRETRDLLSLSEPAPRLWQAKTRGIVSGRWGGA